MDLEDRICKMDALLFALVLEVALLQLKIQEGSTKLRSSFWKITTKGERAQSNKLEADREMVRDVACQSLVELAEQGQWVGLRRATTALEQRMRAATVQRNTHDSLAQTREVTTEDFQTKREEWAQELRKADYKIAYLRDQLKDDLLNAGARLRYAERWLSARADALELRCQWRGAPAPRVDHEKRVHAELCRAFELRITEHEKSLECWRIRYSDDTANINERLAGVREQFLEAIKSRETLESLYKLHDGEIQSWLRFKRERAARLEHERRTREAAMRVQAWWRGVMVRRALGAFRDLRGSGKPPAKGKKK